MAGKFDNANQSFINSAGAQQAGGQPVDPNAGLSNEAKPSKSPPFGAVGSLLDLFANIPGVPQACHAILKPGTQLVIAGTAIVAIAAGGEAPGAAFMSALSGGAAVFFAGEAGKALLVHVVAQLAHTAISANAGPVAWGNYVSGGTKIMADNSCFAVGCKQLTPTQSAQLDSVMRQEQIAAARARGWTYRYLATTNPRSALSQTLFALPSSPAALFGRMDQFFASLFNPARLAFAGGHLAMATTRSDTAYAEDTTDPVTGQLFVGRPLGMPSWDIVENDKLIKANGSQFSKYQSCYNSDAQAYADRVGKGSDSDCDKLLDSDSNAQRYAQYKADHLVIHGLVLLKNKNHLQTASGSGGGSPAGTIDLNSVYQPSDNIACAGGTNDVGNVTGYHNDAPIQIKLCALPNLASSSDESTPGGTYYVNGANGLALVNSRASGAFLALASAAKAAGLPIAATSTFRTMAHQQALFNGDSGGAEVAVPGRSNHQMGLAIDFSCNGSLLSSGDQCFSWLSQNAGKYGIQNLPSEAWHWSVDGH